MSDHRIHEAVYLEIEKDARTCFDQMIQFTSYPEWQGVVTQAIELERENNFVTIEFHVDLKIKDIRYVLKYEIDYENTRFSWEYLEGDVLHVDGDYKVEDIGPGRSLNTYRLDLHPGFWVPKPLIGILKNTAMVGVLKDLRKKVMHQGSHNGLQAG